MPDLISKLKELKNSDLRELVQERVDEFEKVGVKGDNRWFSELSFCILTANSSAQLGIDIQKELGAKGFIETPLPDLQEKLKELGHRFYRTRAEYIVEARQYSDTIKNIITDFSGSFDARGWLVDNVKGIGYKEGSHFLRNVGYKNPMILDRHILRILDEWNVIEQVPKTLTKNRYLAIENKVKKLADELQITPAEVDLYIWYMDTGKVLK